MEKTLELMESIALAENHTAQIEERVEKVDQELEEIRSDLAKTKDVHEALDKLSTALENASILLASASVIPNIGIAASTLKKTIDITRVPVDKAKDAAQVLETISQEIRAKIYKVEAKVEEVDQQLLKTLNTQSHFLGVLGDAQMCIDSLPASEESKKELAEQMEEASETINPIVQNFDSAQKAFLDGIKDVEANIDKAENWAGRLINMEAEINRLIRQLRPMIETLEEIKQALKKTVRVPYGFKPKWCRRRIKTPFGRKKTKYPCGKEPIYFRFTVWQILTGAATVIKPVMDLLNKEVDKILRPLLRKLNLDIDLSGIPGVEEVETLRNQIEVTMNATIDDFTRLLIDIDGPIGDFSKEMVAATETIKTINDKCHLNIEEQL